MSVTSTPVMACCGSACSPAISGCGSACACTSTKQTKKTIEHITEAFKQHQKWMKDIFARDGKKGSQGDRDSIPGIVAALQIMTSQLTAAAVHETMMIGAMLDAKHQLETQRLFQTLTARAHKDYQPSEGMCAIGTTIRGLAASERKGEIIRTALAGRMNARQLMSGDVPGQDSTKSDSQSRMVQFIKTYCNPADNGNGLKTLCGKGGDKKRRDKDISYTTTLDLPLTLKLDFTPDGIAKTEDEEDLLALSANLYAQKPLPIVDVKALKGRDKNDHLPKGTQVLLDLRAIAAKRSVAQNTLASIAALKAEGTEEARPFIYAALKELGGEKMKDEEIKKILGEKPSYYAQMEMLSSKFYQNPVFYVDLYDKPANVKRKEAAMQAIELMQKRDIYRSLLRSEMMYSVILETELMKAQEAIESKIDRFDQEGGVSKQ